MECKLKDRNRLITAYVMNELADEDRAAFEEHFFRCEQCYEELQVSEDALKLIQERGDLFRNAQPVGHTRKTVTSRIISQLLLPGLPAPARLGIAAALIIAVVMLLTLINKETSIYIADDIDQNGKQLAMLDGPAFEPDPYMEDWITERTRTGFGIIDTVISPNIGEVVYDDIVLRWRMTDAADVSVRILTNIETLVFSERLGRDETDEPEIVVSRDRMPHPGLYYWQIEDERNILFVGKFYFLQRD